ncbi:hypothetical protein KUCAC02_024788 [Chaenocephalus aceratus]|nr:hypothetical protein KUCAC02_024788 [Chaenocephalus aceratus]
MTSLFSVGPPTSGLMVKKKKKDEAVIKEKMQRSFSLRRQEILQEPKIPEFLNKWPALFDVSEQESLWPGAILGPRAEQQPWHYRHAAKWLRAHPEAAGPEVKLNHRTLYQEAREKINVGPVIGIPSKVWRRIQPKGLDNRLKDLNWLCLLRCLPVREIMHRHGLARSPVCPRPDCKDEESIRHVIWKEGLGLVG